MFRAAPFISYQLVWLDDIYLWWGRSANREEIDKEIDDVANVTNIYGHFYVLAATTTKVQSQNRIFYGLIGGYILPVLYALLGATAFGLRALSEDIAASTVQTTSAARLYAAHARRACRFANRLFSDFTKDLLLPLAAAFLAGYSVEIVFAFLDAVIRSAEAPASARLAPDTNGRSSLFSRTLLVRMQHQPLDAAVLDEMTLKDLVDIAGAAIVIPHAFGIDHHVRAKLAAVEAAGGVDTDVREAELLGTDLHVAAQLLAALLAAAAAGMAGRPRVSAAEDVVAVEKRGIGGHGGAMIALAQIAGTTV